MERLKNKVAIVTGAAGGMGKAIALLFAKEGAKVIATDIQEEVIRIWVKEAKTDGLQIDFLKHDVSSEQDWEQVVSKATSVFGGVDILVNNAGICPLGTTTETTSLELWNKVFAINVTAGFLGTKLCVPLMRKAGKGAIVNIASISGLRGGGGTGPAYPASKAAVIMMTKEHAAEYGKDNIRVNVVLPGPTRTPMMGDALKDQHIVDMINANTPLGKAGTPEDIAYGALYFASSESAQTTGSELIIDGGITSK